MPPPLCNRRIVVTRPAAQAAPWLAALHAAGAVALALPTIAIVPPRDAAPLETALAAWPSFDGVIFTSANAVHAVCACAAARGLSLSPPRGWLCAIGPATAAALQAAAGWQPTLVPAAAHAEGVLAALRAGAARGRRPGRPRSYSGAAPAGGGGTRPVQLQQGEGGEAPGKSRLCLPALAAQRIFFPRAAAARTLIPGALRAAGAVLISPECYATVPDEASRAPAAALFPSASPGAARGRRPTGGGGGEAPGKDRLCLGADAVVLSSPSTAHNLAALLGPAHALRMAGVVAAVIGPTTRRAAAALGWPNIVEAPQPDIQAIIAALAAFWHA